jgi:hypothetical protein
MLKELKICWPSSHNYLCFCIFVTLSETWVESGAGSWLHDRKTSAHSPPKQAVGCHARLFQQE